MQAETAVRPGPIELRELEAFVAVATLGSFTKASHELQFDQSTVTRHVQQLERDLRLVLLERTSRKVELTADGRSFLPHARRTVDSARRAVEFARELARRGRSG